MGSSLLLGFLALLGLLLAARTILSLYAEGSINGWEALLFGVIALGIAGVGMKVQPIGFFLLLFLAALPLLNPLLSSLLSARAERKALLQDVHHLGRIVKERPDYGYAHYKLALALYKLGRLDEAISEMELALRYDPADHRVKKLLKAWLREKRIKTMGLKVCPKCLFENPPREKFCMCCGERISFEGYWKEFLAQPRSIALLIGGFFVCLGLYGALSLWGRSPFGAGLILLLTGGLSVAALLWARNKERQRAGK